MNWLSFTSYKFNLLPKSVFARLIIFLSTKARKTSCQPEIITKLKYNVKFHKKLKQMISDVKKAYPNRSIG